MSIIGALFEGTKVANVMSEGVDSSIANPDVAYADLEHTITMPNIESINLDKLE